MTNVRGNVSGLVTGGVSGVSANRIPVSNLYLPLTDAGAGVCNTTLTRGYGTVTFTANSTRYARLSTGLYALVSANQPRAHYSRTGVYLGYWAETARSDVLGTTAAIRRAMTDPGWVASDITVGSAVGVDGGATSAASLTASAGDGTILFTTVLTAAVRTYGAWVRRKTGSGVIQMTKDGGASWTTITVDANYPELPQSVTTANAANPVVGFKIVESGDAIEVDFNTLEVASFSNRTPIPINVAKAADLLTLVPATGNLSGLNGTMYAEVTAPASTGGQADIIATTAGGGVPIFLSSTTLLLYDGSSRNLGSVTPSATPQKICVAWGGVTCGAYINGTAGAAPTTFDGNLDAAANLTFGIESTGSNALFGGLKEIKGWMAKLPANVQQSLTA